MGRQKEPVPIYIESPGEKFWEQIEVDGQYKYVFYNPPNEFRKEEQLSYDSFNLGEQTETFTIHYTPIKKCPWPLAGEPIVPSEDLWTEIHGYIYRHVDLPDERLYDVATAWIQATWISEAWIAVPYFHLLGVKKSGKTRLLEVLQRLSYRGILTPNVSEAALFRCVEAYKPTLLLDETEIYSKEEKSSIQHLLNAGYRRGQWVMRVNVGEKESIKLELFDPFGFKALAGTGGFKDTLESRSIRINMEKNIRPVEDNIDEEKAKELRSQLLYWRFRRLSEVSEVSEVSPDSILRKLDFADGRFKELYTPLLVVSNHGTANILSYARDSYEAIIDEEQISIEAMVLQAIIKCQPELESGKFSTSLATEKFNEGRTEKEQWGTRSIGRVISRLGFRSKRMSNGPAGYVYDERRVKRLCERYGIMSRETSQTSLTSLEQEEYSDFLDRREQMFQDISKEGEGDQEVK